MQEIIEELKRRGKLISTMESCTGGGVANAITNVSGSSSVIREAVVTYANEVKIKYGVDPKIIETYTVYSMETANSMSKAITEWTGSDYGIGVTGQINDPDPENIVDNSNKIYISVYDKENDKFYNRSLTALNATRQLNKDYIIDTIIDIMKSEVFNYGK